MEWRRRRARPGSRLPSFKLLALLLACDDVPLYRSRSHLGLGYSHAGVPNSATSLKRNSGLGIAAIIISFCLALIF